MPSGIPSSASEVRLELADEYTPEEFQEMMDVVVNGRFYTAQAVAEVFKRQGFVNIIFTASISATPVNTP